MREKCDADAEERRTRDAFLRPIDEPAHLKKQVYTIHIGTIKEKSPENSEMKGSGPVRRYDPPDVACQVDSGTCPATASCAASTVANLPDRTWRPTSRIALPTSA